MSPVNGNTQQKAKAQNAGQNNNAPKVQAKAQNAGQNNNAPKVYMQVEMKPAPANPTKEQTRMIMLLKGALDANKQQDTKNKVTHVCMNEFGRQKNGQKCTCTGPCKIAPSNHVKGRYDDPATMERTKPGFTAMNKFLVALRDINPQWCTAFPEDLPYNDYVIEIARAGSGASAHMFHGTAKKFIKHCWDNKVCFDIEGAVVQCVNQDPKPNLFADMYRGYTTIFEGTPSAGNTLINMQCLQGTAAPALEAPKPMALAAPANMVEYNGQWFEIGKPYPTPNGTFAAIDADKNWKQVHQA